MSSPQTPTTGDHLKRLQELRDEVEKMRRQCGFAPVPAERVGVAPEPPIAAFPTTEDGAPAVDEAIEPA